MRRIKWFKYFIAIKWFSIKRIRLYKVCIFLLVSIWQHCFWQITRKSLLVSLWNLFSLVYNFIMNEPTNEQRLQIIEFYYHNSCSVKNFFIEKFCSATKLISGWMATSTSKIAAYGMKTSQKRCKCCQCILKKALFGVDYGPVASSGRTSSKTTMRWTLLWMASVTVWWLTIFFAQNGRIGPAWHVVSTIRCHMPHGMRNNDQIESRLWWTVYLTFGAR